MHAGRTEPSLGRRRRDVSDNKEEKNRTSVENPKANTVETVPAAEEERVRQVIEVRGGKKGGQTPFAKMENFRRAVQLVYVNVITL